MNTVGRVLVLVVAFGGRGIRVFFGWVFFGVIAWEKLMLRYFINACEEIIGMVINGKILVLVYAFGGHGIGVFFGGVFFGMVAWEKSILRDVVNVVTFGGGYLVVATCKELIL
jgi:hypothetical protein